jgi:hypothetical protein
MIAGYEMIRLMQLPRLLKITFFENALVPFNSYTKQYIYMLKSFIQMKILKTLIFALFLIAEISELVMMH